MPTSPAVPVVSARPVHLDAPGRGTDLTVRVTAPATGTGLPLVVLSHGYHQSERGYVTRWSTLGLSTSSSSSRPTWTPSRSTCTALDDPTHAHIWTHPRRRPQTASSTSSTRPSRRAQPCRASRQRTASSLAGHSWGGQTARMLLGARVLDGPGTG